MNRKISVSNEVSRALQQSKKSADQILREVLLKQSEGLVTKEGVEFPNGTAFQAWYKGRSYYANLIDGMIEIMGHRVDTPSAAAKVITGRPTNGWEFWHCKRPSDQEFVLCDSIRAKLRSSGNSSLSN